MPQIVEAKTVDEWVTEGIELGQAGKYAEAIKSYDEALKINPQYAQAWNNKGVALKNLGKPHASVSRCLVNGMHFS